MDLALLMNVLLIALVPVGIVLGIWYQHRREQATRQWAAKVGWSYVGTDSTLAHRWQGRPFGVGRSRRVGELVTGSYRGRSACSFRYTYVTGSGKNQRTVTHHVVAVSLPAYLPRLELEGEDLGTRLAKTFGGQDINFESEAFNRAWRVQAFNLKYAHDVLHPRLLERLLRPDARGMNIRIEGGDILAWSSGNPDLGVLAGRLDVLCAIVESVPRYVWLDHGHDPAQQTRAT